jgi:hypothetical protein
MPLPAGRNRIEVLGLFPGSVLAELQKVSQKVGSACRWDQLSAALFVLTGSPPVETGIRYEIRPEWGPTITAGSFPAEEVIVLYIDSWLSPPTVADHYRKIQALTLGGRSRAHDTSLEIVKLAVQMMKPGEALPEPERLMRKWNRTHLNQPYTELWRFKSHYSRAFDSILLPGKALFDRRSKEAKGR